MIKLCIKKTAKNTKLIQPSHKLIISKMLGIHKTFKLSRIQYNTIILLHKYGLKISKGLKKFFLISLGV